MESLTKQITFLTRVLVALAVIQIVLVIIDRKKNNRIIKIVETIVHKKVGSYDQQSRSFI